MKTLTEEQRVAKDRAHYLLGSIEGLARRIHSHLLNEDFRLALEESHALQASASECRAHLNNLPTE